MPHEQRDPPAGASIAERYCEECGQVTLWYLTLASADTLRTGGVELVNESLQTRAWCPPPIQTCEQLVTFLGITFDYRVDQLVFGLEVVKDVTDGHVGLSGDVGQRRTLDALVVDHPASTLDQLLTFLGSLRSARPDHVHRLHELVD